MNHVNVRTANFGTVRGVVITVLSLPLSSQRYLNIGFVTDQSARTGRRHDFGRYSNRGKFELEIVQ
jgi:hypothetical protein